VARDLYRTNSLVKAASGELIDFLKLQAIDIGMLRGYTGILEIALTSKH
jgi:hypothetical protein